MSTMSPCKSCEHHTPGCHGKCEHYAEFRKRLDEVKAKRDEEREKNEYFYSRSIVNERKKKNRNGK